MAYQGQTATPEYGIPYPSPNGRPVEAGEHFKELALALEDLLKALNLPPLNDTGWIPVTGVNSSYTVHGAQLRAIGGVLYGQGYIEKKSGAIASGTVRICDLPAGIPPITITSNFNPVWKNTTTGPGIGWISASSQSISINSAGNGATAFDLNAVNGMRLD